MDWIYWLAILLLGAALAWSIISRRRLERRLGDYAANLRRAADGTEPVSGLPSDVRGLERVSNAVAGLITAFEFQLSTLDSERARLAAVLEQMTDGVLIADPEARPVADPAERLSHGAATGDPSARCCATTNHRLAARPETGEMQVEPELPASRQFVQVIVIPDQYARGGSLVVVQDLTRLRRLETVRQDFISNLSHELRTPLASLKALAETLQDGALEDPPAARRFLDQIAIEVDLRRWRQSCLISHASDREKLRWTKPVNPLDLLFSVRSKSGPGQGDPRGIAA
jgi:two-component system phosphate regulon sensor histidine kinase PhoR